MKYVISWTIEMETESSDPLTAAQAALQIHRDPDSTANVFTVEETEGEGRRYQVDLMTGQVGLISWGGEIILLDRETSPSPSDP